MATDDRVRAPKAPKDPLQRPKENAMNRSRLILLILGLAVLVSPIAQAGTVLFADIVWEADGRQKHPAVGERTIIIRDDTGGPVEVCVGYINNFKNGSKGTVSAAVEIARGEGESQVIETVNLGAQVRNNGFGQCKKADALSAGDSVTFPFAFGGFPRMGKGDVAVVAGAVAIDGGNAGRRSACSGSLVSDEAGTVLLADNVYQADKKQKHPRASERTIVIREDTEGPVEVCLGYLNNLDKASKGKISAKVEVARVEETEEGSSVAVETVKLAAKVRKNKVARCKSIEGLEAGDSVTFPIRFKNFPRIRKDQIVTVVSGLTIGGGEPFRNTSCSAGGGTSGGGGGGGALSAADQSAIVKLASWPGGGRGIQLRLQTAGRHYVDARFTGGRLSSFGPKQSIAEVVNLACASIGCGSGGGLSGADQESVVKLQRSIRSSVHRLGLRFESGGVHIDWQGPPDGIHTGPFGSITAAVNNFCSHPQGGCL
jgi:hypothetical protein